MHDMLNQTSCTDGFTHTGPDIPGLPQSETAKSRQAGFYSKAYSQSTGSGANSVKGQRETYTKWQWHLSPALTSSVAHGVERRVDCGVLCDELGCACICAHAVALRGAFIISDVEYWSEMDDDLVGVGFFSCRLLVFSFVCFFFFLGGESAAYLLALPHLVTSEALVLIFSRFLWRLPTSSAGVESFGESKAECHELTSSGRSCVGQVPSRSMLAG